MAKKNEVLGVAESENATAVVVEENKADDDLLIIGDDGTYTPTTVIAKALNPGYAYVNKETDLYYPFRGVNYRGSANVPGLYIGDDESYSFIEPSPKQMSEYKYSTHLENLNQQNIVKVLADNKNIHYQFPESSKLFIPDISERDDILKRAIKLALKAKNIDLDSCKERFTDKNALFNFKQVIKSETGRLSILLFERGCDALGLKFSIILEEADPKETVGTSLADVEARKNIIRNICAKEVDDPIDVNVIPDRIKDNFRDDDINLSKKIIVSSTDTYNT